ncbi:conserved hypothetical protein [Leishmania major strain Friedlin]|uniref:Uncharacterized protein n=1 Tax=Leishmania major TaxID=5664 RepID=Q4QHQ7_LEIMA|nr:conserved hypothetical protein [Leishmania major strain Friedlin]CAG9569734.1 hypothetical_protein_-__conserved [Leishmania major strain Friedlin]CAJ02929.1 conserved hypothetical protein [Leishmania major strain Friedlin]|eukprot:XP_001681291.1 conserved hypothetical protein [Leishmania major strain Friedlin]
MQRTKPAVTVPTTSPKAAQAPKEPTITIISSDGEAFSLIPSTIAHSHLLEGAVRRWAEIYQAKVKERWGAPCTPTEANDDEDDATADDLEETPDENYIAHFYEETASDVTTTSGALEDVGSGGGAGAAARPSGRGAATAAATDDDDDAESKRRQRRPHAARTKSARARNEEDAHHPKKVALPFEFADTDEGTSVARRASGDGESNLRGADNGDTDSDRTASVLPSSVESSMSSTSSPLKSQSNGGTPTRASDAAGVLTELAGVPRFTHTPRLDTHAQPSPMSTASLQHSAAAVGVEESRSGNVCNTPTGAAAHALTTTAATIKSRNARSPAATGTSSSSRSSRVSPSTLMDADQSTPSVLSGEEGEEREEERGRDEGAGGANGGKRPSRDSRNLGDEGLDSVEVSSSSSESMSPFGCPANTTTTVPNGRGARRHRDPVVSASSSFTSSTTSSSSHLTSSGGGRSKGHRHSSTVVKVGAAEADDDFDEEDKGDAARTDVGVALDTAAAAAMTSTGSARSGSGRPSTSPPPPDWCSPSSCHQRTPCMTDEDDVGAMMAEDRLGAPAGISPALTSSRTESIGCFSLSTQPPLAPGAGGTVTASVPSPMDHISLTAATHAATSASAAAETALATKRNSGGAGVKPLTSSLAYADGIRITSSAIVFDLVRSASPCASPSSGKAAAAVPVVESAASAAGAPPTAAAPTVNIHSSTLLVCIKYMKHFAEAEAQAAADAAAAGKCRKHLRHKYRHCKHRRGRHSSDSSGNDDDQDSSATGTSSASSLSITSGSSSDNSDEDDDDTEVSTVSDSSFSPMSIGAPPGGPCVSGGAVRRGNPDGAPPGTAAGTPASPLGGPAAIPAPLTTPLVSLLSPWEQNFLYVDLLGAPETVLAASLAILDVCPDFDYSSPSVHLGDAKARAALMAPPPPPEGVHTLIEVMAAAKQLQIEPLHALCAGWLADFMIRASYGATDNFEAAHLIRQCLRVTSDWSRRETDCLKIENEWPANEESE